jgi:hypothetical protein
MRLVRGKGSTVWTDRSIIRCPNLNICSTLPCTCDFPCDFASGCSKRLHLPHSPRRFVFEGCRYCTNGSCNNDAMSSTLAASNYLYWWKYQARPAEGHESRKCDSAILTPGSFMFKGHNLRVWGEPVVETIEVPRKEHECIKQEPTSRHPCQRRWPHTPILM